MSKWIVLLACTFALAACDTTPNKSSGDSGAPPASRGSSGAPGMSNDGPADASPTQGGQWGNGAADPAGNAPSAYPPAGTPRQ